MDVHLSLGWMSIVYCCSSQCICWCHSVFEKTAALHSGFAEILGDSITILAESVEWPDEIDVRRAEEAKVRAERRINDSSQDMNRAELALKRSVVRLQLTKKM